MSKKNFTQEIADILADDLATLESIEPGAILRPELTKDRNPAEPSGTSAHEAQPQVGAAASAEPAGPDTPHVSDSGPQADAMPPEAEAIEAEVTEAEVTEALVTEAVVFEAEVVVDPAQPGPSIPGVSAQESLPDEEPTLPLVDASDVDQPELFSAREEPAASISPEPPASLSREPVAPDEAPPTPSKTRRGNRQPPAEEPQTASASTEGSEPGPTAERDSQVAHQRGGGGGSGSDWTPDDGGDGGQALVDSVTLVEVTPPEEGGVLERQLPGDRSLSPPSPPKGRRAWNHPVARWATYILVVIGLTAIFLFLLIEIFHLG